MPCTEWQRPTCRIVGYFSAIARVDRHGVHILQHDGIWADRQHVLANLPQMRNGAQTAHDAADAERIRNRLAQAIFTRHLEIGDGAGLIAADLEGHDNEIRTGQRLFLVRMGLGLRLCAKRRNQLVDDDGAFFQPLAINIHQCDGGARKGRTLQHVADDVLHEHRRACADECDLGISCHVYLQHWEFKRFRRRPVQAAEYIRFSDWSAHPRQAPARRSARAA